MPAFRATVLMSLRACASVIFPDFWVKI
jgi:hypothetical protein